MNQLSELSGDGESDAEANFDSQSAGLIDPIKLQLDFDEEGDDDDAFLDSGDVCQLIREAYNANLNPEVLMASRKASLSEARSNPAEACEDGTRKIRVLVVDDEKGYLALISQNLERTGRHITRTVLDSSNAMGAIDEFKPDLVILDIEMPVINGNELVDMIRSSIRWDDLPLIMLSGLVTEAGRIGVATKGLLYLAKSVSPMHLVHCVDEQLVRRFKVAL